jgi:RyR domain
MSQQSHHDLSEPELAELAERLSRRLHEAWVDIRVAQRWTYGPHRNDDRREHPCLVPYDDLPEEEQSTDREMALAALRAIRDLGYMVVRRDAGDA